MYQCHELLPNTLPAIEAVLMIIALAILCIVTTGQCAELHINVVENVSRNQK